ncbi:hypothetical protein HOY80DRAFT_1040525 [Tuber brumale]|nr:hypothetical protein HOY80DRAFT_1040525 [Tuber brumale]
MSSTGGGGYVSTRASREKTLGVDHRDTLLSVNNLGVALRNQNAHHEANIYRHTLVAAQKTLGPDDRDTVKTQIKEPCAMKLV